MIDSLFVFGNPQSIHYEGRLAKEAIERSRASLANLLNADPTEIYFTSSGTESNNWAIKGIARANENKGRHIISSPIEHISILNPLRTLEKMGFSISFLPVDQFGMTDPEDVRKAIRKDTILISINHASNEIGTIQPISEIGQIAEEHGVIFHTDAVASCGQIPLDIKKLKVSAASLAGHTFYGPKGIGALYLRKGTKILPLLEGGGQEEGRRAGTENLLGIIGIGKAAEVAKENMADWIEKVKPLRDLLIKGLLASIERSYLTGHPTKRLPGHSSFCIEFVEGEAMLLLLDEEGIAAASGSACTSRSLKASHVLLAIGVSLALAQGSLLFTLGKDNNEEEIQYLLNKLPPIVKRLRDLSPLYAKYLKEKAHQGGRDVFRKGDGTLP